MTSACEAAVALYRGDFMPGCYDEWAEELRSYYREQYLHTLEELVGAAQKVQEWTRSLQLALVLGSVAILATNRAILAVSGALGAIGAALTLNGFLLLFPLPF